MKAFLLAAGYGKRLRPLTNKIPKCLAPVNNIPLLYYWLKLFEKNGINEILINTHYLNELIISFCKKYSGPVKINTYYEDKLLGSYGTIIQNSNFIKNESGFFICYSDNLTNINLKKMLRFHQNKFSELTVGLFETNSPKNCGIIEINQEDKILSFIEKPSNPRSFLANSGILYVSTKLFMEEKMDNKNELLDISNDFITPLVGKRKLFGYKINDLLIDIGSIKNYHYSNKLLKSDPLLFKEILNC